MCPKINIYTVTDRQRTQPQDSLQLDKELRQKEHKLQGDEKRKMDWKKEGVGDRDRLKDRD